MGGEHNDETHVPEAFTARRFSAYYMDIRFVAPLVS
jgi:hypothetical protein